jgi:hypothetical protein
MDISNPETDIETLRPIYKISVCSVCKHRFIPKLKKWGDFYKTCENCREHQDI